MAKFSTQFLQGLLQPSYQQGLFTTAQQLGARPRKMAQQQMLSGMDPNTPEGLSQLAQFYQSQGDMQSAMQFANAARDMVERNVQQEALANRKAQIKTQAENLGLDDLAAQIQNVTDTKELGDLVGTMIDYRLKNMPTQTPAQRKQLARQRGISDKLFKELGLGQAPDQVFNDVLTGQRGGDIEFFLKDNEVLPFRTEGGQVYDRENTRWVSAQELGLRKAPPEVQKIENIGSTMTEGLIKEGVEYVADARTEARKAVNTVESIDISLENLDNMFTGYGATFRTDVARAARLFGIDLADTEKIANTEEYAGLSGARVADYISNLGAGTGISEKDLEFTEKVVAANVNVTPEAMRKLLEILRRHSIAKIEEYNGLRNSVAEELKGKEKAAMAFYPLVDMPPERVEPEIDDTDLTTGSTVNVGGVQYVVD